MASYLEKIFTWQYFEPVLFTTIGVLLLLLFIVLYLGKKDKNKKDEESKQIELNSLTSDSDIDAFAEEPMPIESVEVNEDIPGDDKKEEKEEEKPVMNMETTEESTEIINNENEDVGPEFEIFADNSNNESTAPSEVDDSSSIEDNKDNTPAVTWEIPEATSVVGELYNSENKNEDDDIPAVTFEEKNVKDSERAENENVDEPIPVVVSSDAVEDQSKNEEDVTNNEVEVTEEKIRDFKESFADLASSINKELEEINRLQSNPEEPTKTTNNTLPENVTVTPIDEATKVSASSVFDGKKPILEEIKEDEIPFFTKNSDDSHLDIPATKIDEEDEVEPPTVITPDFSSFAEESYDINK